MAFTLVTTQTIIARNAGVLYNTEAGNADMANWVALAGPTAASQNAFLNAVYTASVGTTAYAVVAANVTVGLLGAVVLPADTAYLGVFNYVLAALKASAPGNEGAVINAAISTFSGITANPVYDAFVTAFNAKVANAQTYAQTVGNITNNNFAGVGTSVGSTFTLTIGIDSGAAFTGGAGDDIFNSTDGVSPAQMTLTALDSIDGGAGNNTLNVVNTVAIAIPASATVKNIQTANLTSALAVSGDVSGWTGLTNLNVLNSTGADTITAAGTTAVSIVDTVGTVAVVGGSTVTISTDATSDVSVVGTAGATTAVTVTGGAVHTIVDANSSTTVVAGGIVPVHAAPATATANTITAVTLNKIGNGANIINSDALTTLNLNISTVAGGSVNVNAAAATRALTVNLNGNTGTITLVDATATTLNVNNTGAATTGVTATAGAATAVAINSTKALTLATLTANLATTVSIAGAAATVVTVDALATNVVITSTSTGGVTLTQALLAGQQFSGANSTGNDVITLAATSTVVTNVGAGNNTVTLNGALGVGGTVTAGAGLLDTIVVNGASFSLAGVTGFETLGLGALATGAYSAAGFLHLTEGSVAADVIFNTVAAGADLTLTASPGYNTVYTLATNTATDTLALNLTSAGLLVAGSVTATSVETVNILLTDTDATKQVDTLTLVDTTLATLKISGNAGLNLTNASTTVTSVDASGMTNTAGTNGTGFSWTTDVLANASTIKGSLLGGDVIDASAAVAAVTITETAGINSITGSSTIASTLTGGTGADTIVGGAGKDVIVGGGGADLITAGAGADSITISGTTSKIVQAAGDSGANTSTTIQTAELTSTFDVVFGATAGTKIDFGNASIVTGTLTTAGTNLAAGLADTAVFARGAYSAAAGTFTYAANGADTAITYDSNVVFGVTAETIILVGYVSGASTAALGILTLV